MARKDTWSPGPHHECHLQFTEKLPHQKTNLSGKKKGRVGAAIF